MVTCVLLSFRLGLSDGVSVVAARWGAILAGLGYRVITVAGEGPVDRLVPGLAIGAANPPSAAEVAAALEDADLVVVENLCTIPLNLPAARVAAGVLAGRAAVLHHHDPPWQRERFADVTELPPDDPAWRHVTVNHLTARQMADHGIRATTIYNPFPLPVPAPSPAPHEAPASSPSPSPPGGPALSPSPSPSAFPVEGAAAPARGQRERTRRLLGVGDRELLAVHPVRAIARKDIGRAVRVCEELGATYWLTGPVEEGYGATLAEILAGARCRVVHRPAPSAADLYAAADVVLLTSLWEGFGNPPVEAAVWGRPAIVSHYPVAAELRDLGFQWFDPDDLDAVRAHLAGGDPNLIEHNRQVVRQHLSMEVIATQIAALLADIGFRPEVEGGGGEGNTHRRDGWHGGHRGPCVRNQACWD